jgi:hypothetical protein
MRDYGKVHTTFWSSQTIASLSDDGRLLALYLMTSPHTTIAGVFRLPDGYVAEDLRWPAERVAKGFAELFENGFANRCETTKWVWIIKHLVWNPPENPNQRKAAIKCADQVPSQCAWKVAFSQSVAEILGRSSGVKDCNPSGTLPEPFLNQEQEQEQEQDKKSPSDMSAAPTESAGQKKPTIPCPYESVVSLYHERLPELPRVVLRDGPTWKARQTAMRKLWGWVLSSKKSNGERRAESADGALAWIGEYFARARDNDFLMGRTQRGGDHKNWRCDFDFLLTEKGMKHVIEKTQEAA